MRIILGSILLRRGMHRLLKEPARFVEVEDIAKNAGPVWQILHGVTLFSGTVTFLYTSTFTRFAKAPGAQVPGSVAMIWVNILVMMLGTISTSAAIVIFPEERRLLWAPYELLGAWLKTGGAGARAGAFFSGLCFTGAQVALNCSANGYTSGQNLSAMFPKFLDTKRGTLLVAGTALALNPWRFADRASSFTKFLFMDVILTVPGAGLLLADYFIVRRRKIRVSHLFIRDQSSIYWYVRGFNIRAFIAWTLTVAWLLRKSRVSSFCPGNSLVPSIAGLVRSVKDGNVSIAKAWDYPYYLGVFISVLGGGAVYAAICKIWPPSVLDSPTSHGI